MNIASETTVLLAQKHLSSNDVRLAALIEKYGPCTIRPHTNYYHELVDSIVSQQLSVKAANSIMKKFVGIFDSDFPTPEEILQKTPDELRVVGLSYAKANYVQDLARHIVEKRLDLTTLNKLSNDDVILELTKVKGIGEWTAHMFLMFAMGRLDVLAHGDLGIKNGVLKTYGLKILPNPVEIAGIAKKYNWAPYESIACWYIWRSLENKP